MPSAPAQRAAVSTGACRAARAALGSGQRVSHGRGVTIVIPDHDPVTIHHDREPTPARRRAGGCARSPGPAPKSAGAPSDPRSAPPWRRGARASSSSAARARGGEAAGRPRTPRALLRPRGGPRPRARVLPLKLADGTPRTLADGHCAHARVSTGGVMAIASLRSARSRAMTIVEKGVERGRGGASRRHRRGELRSARCVVSRLRPGARRPRAP
jgi:hypothetical protein